jgi:hypothetical protein
MGADVRGCEPQGTGPDFQHVKEGVIGDGPIKARKGVRVEEGEDQGVDDVNKLVRGGIKGLQPDAVHELGLHSDAFHLRAGGKDDGEEVTDEGSQEQSQSGPSRTAQRRPRERWARGETPAEGGEETRSVEGPSSRRGAVWRDGRT